MELGAPLELHFLEVGCIRYNLGELFAEGKGVKQDMETARRWSGRGRRSAAQAAGGTRGPRSAGTRRRRTTSACCWSSRARCTVCYGNFREISLFKKHTVYFREISLKTLYLRENVFLPVYFR